MNKDVFLIEMAIEESSNNTNYASRLAGCHHHATTMIAARSTGPLLVIRIRHSECGVKMMTSCV